jgi:restriction system protein
MTYLDAAHQILQQAGQPLHYRAIAERALAAGLIHPTGLTPEATMGSRLYTQTQEEGSPFVRSGEGRGFFALAEWQPTGIDHQVQRINYETRTELRRLLHTMPADRFETLIAELLVKMGFDETTVQITPFSGDKGIDVTGILRAAGLTEVDTAVQVKRWKGNVGSKIVRELRGSLKVHQQGVIITTSDFSSSAANEATADGKTRISLINGEDLLDLLIRYRVGVQEKRLTVLTIDEEWWTEALGTDLQAVDVVPLVESVTVPMETPPPVVIVETPPAAPATRKTIDFVLFGESYRVSHWRHILIQACAILAQRHADSFAETVASFRGRKRQYIAPSAEGMFNPEPIPGCDFYVETNFSSKGIVHITHKLLNTFGHGTDTLLVERSESSIAASTGVPLHSGSTER